MEGGKLKKKKSTGEKEGIFTVERRPKWRSMERGVDEVGNLRRGGRVLKGSTGK